LFESGEVAWGLQNSKLMQSRVALFKSERANNGYARSATMRIFLSIACLLAISATAMAEPLNPKHVPKDAKWVIHLDHKVLADSELMKLIRNQHSERIQAAREWLMSQYGVDPQQDLNSITMFSDTYESHSGAAIVSANFDRKKMEEQFASKLDVKKSESDGVTCYTWDVKKNLLHQLRQGSAKDAQPGDSTRAANTNPSGANVSYANNAASPSHAQGAHGNAMLTAILLDDKTAIFAPSVERAKAVAKLMKGEGESLDGKESRLVGKIPEKTFLYGAAVDLNKLERADGMFPILRQHSFAMLALSERDGNIHEKLIVTGKDEEVARRMKEGLEGLAAFAKLGAADSEKLAKLQEKGASIQRDGTTVTVEWQGASKDVVAALDELKSRFEQGTQRR
jgi:hypothetical protein